MCVLLSRTVSAPTQVLFLCLFHSLLRNSGNKQKINPLVSTETVRHSSTYIILYIFHGQDLISAHFGLVVSYGAIDLDKQWIRQWLVAWWQQAITWFNVNLPWKAFCGIHLRTGLGRVPDLRVRVQVRVLVICVSPSPSTWLLHDYESEYENWLMSTSTSVRTGLWSIFYIACIGSRFLLFGPWQESPQIVTNLGQSSSCPLSM